MGSTNPAKNPPFPAPPGTSSSCEAPFPGTECSLRRAEIISLSRLPLLSSSIVMSWCFLLLLLLPPILEKRGIIVVVRGILEVLCGWSELLARMLMVSHGEDVVVGVLRGGVRILWRTNSDAHKPCIGASTTAAFAPTSSAVNLCNE